MSRKRRPMRDRIYLSKITSRNAQKVLLITACLFASVVSYNITTSLDTGSLNRRRNLRHLLEQEPLPSLKAKVSTHKNYFDALPKIYAFYTSEDGKRQHWGDDWKLSWQNAGWNPIVLSLQDSKAKNSIKLLSALLEPLKLGAWENFRFYRWAAMAHEAPPLGGWMSEIDVFPLHITPEDGTTLPNKGTLTLHNGIEASLVSGAKSEWYRMLGYMTKVLKERTMENLSYDFVWETILREHPREVHDNRDVSMGYFSYDSNTLDCLKYSSNIKAVHFWASNSNKALLGGRVEKEIREEIRNKFGKELSLRLRHTGNTRIFQEEEARLYRETKYSDADKVDVFIDGTSVGTLHDVLVGMHGPEIATQFMDSVLRKCRV